MSSRFLGLAVRILVCSPILLGCSVVATNVPLSEAPEPIDQERFEGAWTANDGVIHLNFGSDGVARLAGLEWEEDHFAVERGEMIVVEGELFNYLSIRGQEKGVWIDHYLIAQYAFTPDGDLLVWLPDEHAFAEAVLNGDLAGKVDSENLGTDVLITSDPESLISFMNDPGNQVLFDYKEPMVFRRVAGGGD